MHYVKILNCCTLNTHLIVGDGDLVLVAAALILCLDVQNAVGIHIEDDVDLGHTARSRGNAGQLELAQQVVVLGAGALTLVYLWCGVVWCAYIEYSARNCRLSLELAQRKCLEMQI